MDVGWVYDRRFLDHDTGELHIERPERLTLIVEGLREAGLLERLTPIEFSLAMPEQIALVHDPAYVDVVRMMCDEGFTAIGSEETRVCARSYDAAALAVGGVLASCDAVMADRVARAFCAVRPPGHHAEVDQAMGFCLFNNVAVAAEHLVRRHGLRRVAIVDFDVHHGNGTQHMFEHRADVFYVSLHERPGAIEFPGTGEAEEIGAGAGRGFTLNVPLDWGAGARQYRAAMHELVLPALDDFRPEFLLLSAGFDALMWDNVAHVSLEPDDFGWLTDMLVAAADRHAAGRIVSVLEGGYAMGHLDQAVANHVAALLRSE